MQKQAAELLVMAKEILGMPMETPDPSSHTLRWARQSLMMTLRVDPSWKQIYERFMTNRGSGRNNAFHYFGVWKSKTGDCVGGNAYGAIGYNPKAIEVARGSEGMVLGAVQGKVSVKERGGYEVDEV